MNATSGTAAAALVAGLLLGGAISGLLPLLNAEALLAAAVASATDLWLPLSASVAVGQSCAKLLIFLGARSEVSRRLPRPMPAWLARRVVKPERAAQRLRDRSMASLALLQRPLPGSALVAVSAVVGIPPLGVTSILAGVARLPLKLFCSTCLAGRLLRFALIAYPIAQLAKARN